MEQTRIGKVFLPYMCDHALAIAGVMRSLDIEADVLPKTGDEALAIGLSLCRGRECLPCFLCTGDMILKCRELQKRGEDVSQAVFIMPTGPGPCRFGQYNVLHRQILAEQGFPEARFISPTAADAYALFGDRPRTFRMRVCQAFIAVDLLQKVLHEHRPYEVETGSADALYQESLDQIVKSTEVGGGEHLVATMSDVASRFAALPVDRSQERPLIAVIGEIYVLLNTSSNLELVRAVERLGGEVEQGTFIDYLYLVEWKRKQQARLYGNYRTFLTGVISEGYQQHWERRLRKPLAQVLRHPPESSVAEAMQLLQPHYEPILGTEAVLTMGRALDLYRHGVAGFINVLPFSCMPGTICASMAPALREQMDGVPWLDIAYDGQKDTNIHTRLEAFMHQAAQFHRRKIVRGKKRTHAYAH